jgi:DNA polymerase III alpha subunit
MSYVELHCHSCFSFREGASTPLELIMRAKEFGYRALALTDHDNLAGAMEFARIATEWAIRPIIGAEITLDPAALRLPRQQATSNRQQSISRVAGCSLPGAEDIFHLTLLAESPRGYANLSRLLSRANLNSPRGEPRVRFEWLAEHVEGLIALSGCRKGEVASLVERRQAQAGLEAAARYRDIFAPDNYFIELQDNLAYEDQDRNEGLIAIARTLGAAVVATNNVHYHVRERHRLHDALVAVRNRTNLEEARPLLRPNSEFHLKHPSQMQRLFDGLPEALESTLRIAERCTGYGHTGMRADGQEAADDCSGDLYGRQGWGGPATHAETLVHESHAVQTGVQGAEPLDGAYGGCPPIPTHYSRAEQRDSDAQPLPDVRHRGLKPRASEGLTAPGVQTLTLATPQVLSPVTAPRGFDLTRDLTYRFPDYQSLDGRTPDQFLRDLCYQKARDHYGVPLPEHVEIRLLQELDLVEQGKRAGFFLRLWELVDYSHRHQMPARGRGSSVGSMVCFLLGLSGIDPMKYDLVVERFLNEDRLDEDVPDIDIDFGREARDQMFRHIFEEYTTEHAAMVAALIEYRYASAIRDIGKVLGLPDGEIDKIAKRMRSRFHGRLAEELASMPEFAQRLKFPIWQDFIELVEQLHGMPRHLSQHSGGVIISTNRIDEQVPVEATAMDDRYICQWDKDSVADAGFIKLDLLGYPSLDQLARGLRYVHERHGKLFQSQQIELSDPEVYEMIQRGDVIGIVQIQSRAQIQVLMRIKVARIEDLVIQVALIRPGPIQGGAVHPYIARCLGQEEVTYDHPSLEPALKETKGVFVFQEQVIQAAMAIAGFSSGQAEMLRRAMSRKRSREAMEALRNEFLAGAANKGIDAQIAATVYQKILAFAEFGFPKSHAAAMAETAYRVAWLKRYFPVEFYCALLNEQPMGFYSPEVICNDARRHDIEIRGVDVNHSQVECSIEADDALRLGFRYLKGLGEAAYERLTQEREHGPYCSLWDFWRRTRLAREPIENLIRAGAFAWTGLHERELLWQLGTFYQPLGDQLPLTYGQTGGQAYGHDCGHAGPSAGLRTGNPAIGQIAASPHRGLKPPALATGECSGDLHGRQGLGLAANAPSLEDRAGVQGTQSPDGSFVGCPPNSFLAKDAEQQRVPRLGELHRGLKPPASDGSYQAGVAGAQPMRGEYGGCPPILPEPPLPSFLREPTPKERIIADLTLTGIAVRGRSMDLVRDQLHEGITPSHLVSEMQYGEKVTIAGLVAVRQAPETAKGFVFHTIEDYHGLMNVITKPRLIPKYRWLIESAPALIVHGHIERQERSVNVIAERFEPLPITSEAGRRVHSFG